MTLRAVSASQIETFRSCQRKWGWRALDKIEAPPNASAAKGTLIHAQYERYLKGESLDYSTPALREAAERAMPGIVNLPPPGTEGLLVEHGFSLQTSNGILFRGFMDVVVPHAHVVPGLAEWAASKGVGADNPCVIDHKSTSSFRYAKTADVLNTDVQAMVYAYETMRAYRTPTVDLLWNYVSTKGAADTKRVHLRVVSEHVAAQFLGPITDSATQIVTTYAAHPKVLDLRPNTDACDAYGGCPYKQLCLDLHSGPMGHLNQEETHMSQSSVDLFARIATSNVKEDAATASLPAGITNAPDGWTPPAFMTAPASPAVSMFPPPMPAAAVVPINPPESLLERAPAVVPEVKAKPKKLTKAEKAAVAAAVAQAESPPDLGEVYTSDAATLPPPPAADTIPAPPIETGRYSADAANPARRTEEVFKAKPFILYLDCAPENRTTLRASELFAKVNAEIEKSFAGNPTTYQLIKYDGPGLFLAGFTKLFDQTPQDIVLDTRTKEGLLVLEALRARAGMVVR